MFQHFSSLQIKHPNNRNIAGSSTKMGALHHVVGGEVIAYNPYQSRTGSVKRVQEGCGDNDNDIHPRCQRSHRLRTWNLSIESPIMFQNMVQAGQLGENVELHYVVHIIGVPTFFGRVSMLWRVLWPFQTERWGSIWSCPPNKCTGGRGRETTFKTPLDVWKGITFASYLGCFWISRSEKDTTIAKGFTKQPCLLHHECNNCHV